MEKHEIEYLKDLGFEQAYPDALDYRHSIFRLDILKHPLLSGLHIVVSDGMIEVYCLDGSIGSIYDVCIATRKYDRETLESLIHYLS